jgi:lipid-binding SYLF domain-containing protein
MLILRTLLLGVVAAMFMSMVGCQSNAITVAEKRQVVQDMRKESLAMFAKQRPAIEARLKQTHGYAVFSNVGVQVFLLGGEGGRGVVRDNKTGKDTYMKMGGGNVGVGLGVKDYRALIVFNNRAALDKFLTGKWQFGAEADAAAKSGEKGGAAGGEAVAHDYDVYIFTDAGLMLSATLGGTKFWLDDELNQQ